MAKKTKNDLPFDIIKIGYIKAKINAVESREIEKRDNIFGEWFSKNHEIDFDKNMVEAEKVNTILHETLHALCYAWGIKFRNSEQEEEIVNALSSALCTLIKDNPEFYKWMGDVLHDDCNE